MGIKDGVNYIPLLKFLEQNTEYCGKVIIQHSSYLYQLTGFLNQINKGNLVTFSYLDGETLRAFHIAIRQSNQLISHRLGFHEPIEENIRIYDYLNLMNYVYPVQLDFWEFHSGVLPTGFLDKEK